MRKLAYAIAALATIAVSAPTIASAQGIGVYVGGDHGYYRDRYNGPRVGVYEHDRGWHRGWYNHDRERFRDDGGVVIRERRWDR